MSPDTAALVPLYLVSPLLVAMAIGDIRQLRISNRLVLAMVAVFLFSAPFFVPFSELQYRAITAALVFLLGFGGFALRLWGGGDVKAQFALMLFVPSTSLAIYLYVFSASMLIGVTLVLTLRAAVGSSGTPWRSLQPKAAFPMGVSIALSGLLLPMGLYHFG